MKLPSALLIELHVAGFVDLRQFDFTKYGPLFTPSHNQPNVYRTVAISENAANTTVSIAGFDDLHQFDFTQYGLRFTPSHHQLCHHFQNSCKYHCVYGLE